MITFLIISVGKSYSHQEMPYFNREFPVLGGGNSGERLPPHMDGKDPPLAQHGQRPMMRNMRKWAWLLLFCAKKINTVLLMNDSLCELRTVPPKLKGFCARLRPHGKSRPFQGLLESTKNKK